MTGMWAINAHITIVGIKKKDHVLIENTASQRGNHCPVQIQGREGEFLNMKINNKIGKEIAEIIQDLARKEEMIIIRKTGAESRKIEVAENSKESNQITENKKLKIREKFRVLMKSKKAKTNKIQIVKIHLKTQILTSLKMLMINKLNRHQIK